MIGKGVFEYENGIGFKFGMRAAEATEKEAGVSIGEVLQKIVEQKGETTSSLLNYFYGGAIAYATSKSKDLPDKETVVEWMEEIGFTECIRVFAESTTQGKKSPNPEAPSQKGATISE